MSTGRWRFTKGVVCFHSRMASRYLDPTRKISWPLMRIPDQEVRPCGQAMRPIRRDTNRCGGE